MSSPNAIVKLERNKPHEVKPVRGLGVIEGGKSIDTSSIELVTPENKNEVIITIIKHSDNVSLINKTSVINMPDECIQDIFQNETVVHMKSHVSILVGELVIEFKEMLPRNISIEGIIL